jgi:hypothetical protein
MIYYPLSVSVVNISVNVHAGNVDSKYLVQKNVFFVKLSQTLNFLCSYTVHEVKRLFL